MAEQDGYVQVAADGVGKKIDNAELIREPEIVSFAPPGGAGLTVERQRVVLSSDENPRLQASISGEAGRGALHVDSRNEDVLQVLMDIRDMLHKIVY